MSHGTKITNSNKPHCDYRKSDKASISSVPPSWFSNHAFLNSVKQEVEVYQGDSDSDCELRALQRSLGMKLLQEEICSCEKSAESGTDCTLMELDIAHLTINASSDTSGDAGENKDGLNSHQSFEEKSLYSERSSIDGLVFDIEMNTLSSENSNIRAFEKIFLDSCYCRPKENSELCFGQAYGNVAAENSYRPELCTSLHLLVSPKKREVFRNMVYEATPSLRKKLFKFYNFELSCSSIGSNSKSLNDLEKNLIPLTGFSHTTSSPSSLKSISSKIVQSLAGTYSSLLSITEEFLYKDTEAGIQLIERRCPTVAVLSR